MKGVTYMTADKILINNFSENQGVFIPEELEDFLLKQYGQEPFPYEFSEQDLRINIERDICAYQAGELDLMIKSPSESWQEEREYLQNLCIEKCNEVYVLEEYISKLEHMILEHGLECSRVNYRGIDY